MVEKLDGGETASTDLEEEDFFDDDLPPYLREMADEDYVDPELEGLRPEINWVRPLLALTLIAAAVYGMTLFRSQLEFFFLDDTPVDLGDVTDYPTHAAVDPAWKPPIVHNQYVKVTGIPTHFSAICAPPVRFFKLVGAQVYVELPMADDVSAIACRLETQGRKGKIPDLEYFDGTGRAVAFKDAGHQYGSLRTFYEREYAEHFCSSMTEAKKNALLKERRKLLREDVKRTSGEYPDDAKLEALVTAEPLCQSGFIVQAGVTPKSYWHFLLIYVVLIAIILWNLYALATWARKVRPR